jgi:DNA polymerase-3 subunit alpha
MSSQPRFIHLRVHTAYSLLEGAVQLKKLPDMCVKAKMPAVAVTDTNNLFGALEFSEAAAKSGVQPIIGCQFDLAYAGASRPGEKTPDPKAIVLLAQNEAGYMNLMKLNSCAFLEAGDALPHITLDQLAKFAEGLICLSGGALGPVGQLIQDGQSDKARALVEKLAGIYPDRFYMEVQRHPDGDHPRTPVEELTEGPMLALAYEMDLPLVATNDVHFPKRDMYEAHDALICISDGAYVDQQADRRRLTPEHYFKSQDEMVKLFADLPEAVENTVEIAKRCAFKVYKRDPILPKFAENEIEELRQQANEGLKARLDVIPHAATIEEYQARLAAHNAKITNTAARLGWTLIRHRTNEPATTALNALYQTLSGDQ